MTPEQIEEIKTQILQASEARDAERLDLEKRQIARQEVSAREHSALESERLQFEWSRLEIERTREKRESRFLNRHSGPVIVAAVGVISFVGTIVSVRESTRTQKAIAEQTIGVQKAIAEQTQRLQENRDLEDLHYHRSSMMMQFIEQHSNKLFGGNADETDNAVKQMGTIPFLELRDVRQFADRLVALRPNTAGLADALTKTSQQLAQVPVMDGKVLVSDPLKMWRENDNFAFLTTDDLDKPENRENFLLRVPKKGAGARLKKDGRYLAIQVREPLTYSALGHNPWVSLRKKGSPDPPVRVPVLDALPKNNNYPIEISQGLADVLKVGTNDSIEIIYP